MKQYRGVSVVLVVVVLGVSWVKTSKAGYNNNDNNNNKDDGMVRVNGTQMMLNGTPFYWNGFNAYWFMVMATDYGNRSKVSSVLEEARSHGLTVARTWAFSDGGDFPLQISPGVYNETTFQALDYVISEAGNHSIKLILSLVNNYNDFGGKQQYVNWVHPNQNLNADLFFTDPQVKQYYKNHIKTVLTRNNTISGVMYKDDPTIMAWELMNEPRCQSDLSGQTLQDWIKEMAAFLKDIDKKHLLEIGLEGFYGKKDDAKNLVANDRFQLGTDFIANNQIPEIDFATVHAYPDLWLNGTDDATRQSFLVNWTNVHIKDAQEIVKKPIVVAEFGKDRFDPGYTDEKRNRMYRTIYDAIYESAKGGGAAAGGMFWQLFTKRMGNWGDGDEIIFSENPSTTVVIDRQSQRMAKLSKMYDMLKKTEELTRKMKKKRARENNHGN